MNCEVPCCLRGLDLHFERRDFDVARLDGLMLKEVLPLFHSFSALHGLVGSI